MREYNFNQVRKALEIKGFEPTRGFSSETEYTTIFERSSGTQCGLEFATVDEWIEDHTCTINGLNPFEWGKQQFS